MIVNFYKTTRGNHHNSTLLEQKNIDVIPQIGTIIQYSGQYFIVERIYFELDNCKYDVYVVRL